MQNVNCHVTIQAPIDKTVSLSFPTVYFKQSVCDVIGAGITVHDGADQSAPIKTKICSATQGVYSVRSTSDTMYVRFRTGQIPMAFQGVYEFSKYMYFDIVNVFLFVTTLFQVNDLKISNTFWIRFVRVARNDKYLRPQFFWNVAIFIVKHACGCQLFSLIFPFR